MNYRLSDRKKSTNFDLFKRRENWNGKEEVMQWRKGGAAREHER